jgi:hypothetical protein
MPLHDVNDALDDSFLDQVTVIRRMVVVNDRGRRVDSETAFSIMAVVTASTPNDLQSLPEYNYMGKAITVCASSEQYSDRAVLQGPSDHHSADQLLWHGSVFLVMSIDDYSGYGRGFIQATAVSMTQPDPSPIHQPVGSA